jgi:hypothetical protein
MCPALASALAVVLLTIGACQNGKELSGVERPTADPETSGPPYFEDVTDSSGVRITYHNGEESGHYAILESLGGGLALIDFDGDGLLDLFVPGGGRFDGKDQKEIQGLPCRLYKNLGGFRFRDVTAEVGLDKPWFYTHGAAVADFDRDGWPDLLVTGWGRLVLLRNVPCVENDPSKGRKFVDVTDKAKLPQGLWSTSAAWVDLDGDGYPDLYVCQYVNWSFEKNHPTDCNYDGKTRDVCPPKKFKGLPHKLLRNNRDGTFSDVSKEAGLRGPREPGDYAKLTYLSKDARDALQRGDTQGDTLFGKGLGVIAADLNGDRKPDVYVANDTVDNFLYMNRTAEIGTLQFEEKGLETGTARDGDGTANGSMGLDVGDPFGQLRGSIWVTNYENELHALYKNECVDKKEFFGYATKMTGLAANGQDTVGWGTGFIDLDHHGWEDLLFATGHAIRHPKGLPRAERPGLFRNKGNGKFIDIRSRGGPYFQTEHVSRGIVLGDLDNDGKIDVVFCNLNEPVAVLRNLAETTGNHWLGIELVGKDRRDVVGTRIVLESGGRKQARFAKGGGSYASSGDRRHVFGLGKDAGEGLKVTVNWSWGKDQEFTIPAVDRYWRLQQGVAEPVECSRVAK